MAWTPVNKKLPDHAERVLVCRASGAMMCGAIYYTGSTRQKLYYWWLDNLHVIKSDYEDPITHWTNLPPNPHLREE